jgi:protein O-mannosyl-transferase
MKTNNPTRSRKSSRLPEKVRKHALIRWLAPVVVAIVSCAPFVPALWNDFVEWDDYENIVNNPHYRGLGWSQLRWMFTTFHMGPYQPLSWVTLGIDYLIWGMNPFGYHLTNLILHAANAVFFYYVSRRLLSIAWSISDEAGQSQLGLSAAFAALLFAIHPLRLESVAWATERRDVLSGFFYLGTIYCYLRANSIPDNNLQAWRWRNTALALFVLSLLSKAAAMTLPVVLLILDIYPLKRLQWQPRQWLGPGGRAVLWEKIPFVIVAVPFAFLALLGQQQASAFRSLETHDLGSRLAQAFFGAAFYLWKTLIPTKLSPLYEIPPHFTPWDPFIVAGVAASIIITLSLYLLGDRWPAGLACWAYYIVVLAPVLGIVQTGPQLVADRYTYLSCLSWAALAGGVLLYSLRRSNQRQSGAPFGLAAPIAIAGVLVPLALLTWNQTAIWRDTGTLWRHALKLDPNSSIAHYNLARFLGRQGKHAEAVAHYRQALSIRPEDTDARNNLGLLLAIGGEIEASLQEFQKTVQLDPNHARAYFNMGKVFARQGDHERAIRNFQQALKLKPNEAEIHVALGNVLALQGQLEAATRQFEQAVKLKPEFADAHVALARSLAAQSKRDDAEKHYQQALQLLKAQKYYSAGSPGFRGSIDSAR